MVRLRRSSRFGGRHGASQKPTPPASCSTLLSRCSPLVSTRSGPRRCPGATCATRQNSRRVHRPNCRNGREAQVDVPAGTPEVGDSFRVKAIAGVASDISGSSRRGFLRTLIHPHGPSAVSVTRAKETPRDPDIADLDLDPRKWRPSHGADCLEATTRSRAAGCSRSLRPSAHLDGIVGLDRRGSRCVCSC